MDPNARIDQLLRWMEEAKAVPFSTSAVVHRDAIMDELEALRDELPSELRQARMTLAERDEILARARREAERVAADALAQQDRLVSETEVLRAAERRAEEVLAAAEEQAREIRAEADDYIDGKLAEFEIVLHKTLQTVERGRSRLAERMTDADVYDDPHGDGRGAARSFPLYDHEAL